MNFQRKKVASALAYLLGAGGAATLIAAPAQAADIKVEVTGTNIKRVEGEGALPVQVLTRQEIEKSGAQNTMELVNTISAMQSFGNFNPALGEGSGLVGFSGASLRGLGTNRTLVLINGKRVAPYALSTGNNFSGVDLSQIPLAAVERVEVLKDGASAVYGTDAIAGVLNVILRKDFTGVEVGGTYLDSEKGGGANRSAHGTFGWGDLNTNKWNAFITVDYQDQLALRASDRQISKTAYIPSLQLDNTSGNVIPANFTQPPGIPSSRNPFALNFAPAGTTPCLPPFSIQAGRTNTCRFDFTSVIDSVPPATKTNVLGRFTWQVNADNQFFVEGSYNRGDFTQAISPTPVSVAFPPFSLGTVPPPQLFPNSPYYPTAFVTQLGGDPTKPITLAYRALEFGRRTDEVTVDQYRAVAGMQGLIAGWDYAVDFNYTENKQVDAYKNGYLSGVRFQQALASGLINPFGFNNAAGLAAGNAAQIVGDASNNKASNYGVNAKISNDIYKLPAGPLGLALGVEYRKETLELQNSDFLSSGDIIGGLGAIPSLSQQDRNVFAAYGELNIPIVNTLEGNIAVRYDHYSDFGSTTNPKFSLRWQPTKDLLVRGSYGTGFRAPTLFDLDQPIYITNTNNAFDDPIRCPVTGDTTFDCGLQFNSKRGGNSALKPERSSQYNVGVVWEPSYAATQGMSFGVDYYWIEIKDVITQVAADTIFADYAAFANTTVPASGYNGAPYIVRAPGTDPNFPGLPNKIDYVIEPTVNLGKNGVSGIDVDLQYRVPPTLVPATWGKWTAHFNGSYIIDFKQTDAATGAYPNLVGQAGSPQGAISRWRHYATLDWAYGPWGVTVADTYQNGYQETYISTITGDTVNRRVGSYDIWDVQGRFTGWKNVRLAAGIRNIMDRQPPQAGGPGTFQVGYDPSYADPRGRMYYGSIDVSFH
jgi:iron complex outermembrane receptor protein